MTDPKSEWDYKDVEGHRLIYHEGKIHVPQSIQQRVLKWYHHYLCHPGGERLANTLLDVCTWKEITSQARKLYKECKTCQKFKKQSTWYGHLVPKEAEMLELWHTVCVDLIGTYNVKAKVKQIDGSTKVSELQLLAMTFIDPATEWFKITEVPQIDQTSASISRRFDREWLSA